MRPQLLVCIPDADKGSSHPVGGTPANVSDFTVKHKKLQGIVSHASTHKYD